MAPDGPGFEAGPESSLEPGFVVLLDPAIQARLISLRLPLAQVNRYGSDRVRWALDRLDAEREREGIANGAAWVRGLLLDTWGEPDALVQLGLPFARAAAALTRPPAGTRWAREGAQGRVLELERIDEDSIKFTDGTRLPAWRWGEGWQWFSEQPPEAPPPPPTQRPDGRADLALVAAWCALRARSEPELAAKLASRGLTLADWQAYQAER